MNGCLTQTDESALLRGEVSDDAMEAASLARGGFPTLWLACPSRPAIGQTAHKGRGRRGGPWLKWTICWLELSSHVWPVRTSSAGFTMPMPNECRKKTTAPHLKVWMLRRYFVSLLCWMHAT